MHHYTREEKLKAVQLYIQYGKSPTAVIYELGYPSKSCLFKIRRGKRKRDANRRLRMNNRNTIRTKLGKKIFFTLTHCRKKLGGVSNSERLRMACFN